MILVLGIGNPGPEYKDTRHNVGFMILDNVAEAMDIRFGHSSYRAMAATGRHAGRAFTLLKPLTFVNLSGDCARLAVSGLGVDPASGLLVVTDDADLEPGVFRFRRGGGSGGHNGIESISAAVGNDYTRLRVGVGRSGGRLRDHVLSPFAEDEMGVMADAINGAAHSVVDWIAYGLTYCQNAYNKKTVTGGNQQPIERS
ncbi:MAG: aminoacyl-tRNA hydrolase [Planctomycetes bacterium]|nr:aminoacyl-tRNA hydrolase [Planctomycetota bacterium]